MDRPIDINRRRWDELAIIHARDTTDGYGLDHGGQAAAAPRSVMNSRRLIR
jgi:hypothetical protein